MRQFPLPPRFAFSAANALIMGVVGLVMLILAIIIWWRIFSKAGYSGVLGLLMFVPIANIIVLLMLAFGTWPIEKEVRRLRNRQ